MLYVSWFLFAVNIKSIKPALGLHLMSSRLYSMHGFNEQDNRFYFIIIIMIMIMAMIMIMIIIIIITIVIAVISERDGWERG